MLMEIPRIDYNRAVTSPGPTPVPTLEPSAAPSPVLSRSPSPVPVPPAVSEPPAPSRSVPVSAPDAPPVSVSWNDSSLSPNHASSPYVHQLPGYLPPFSPPYHAPVAPYHAPASSGFALPPQDTYLGAPLYDAHVSREVLSGARKRHSRDKRERKERKMERKRKEKERIRKREEDIRKREEKIRKREEKEKIRKREKREKRERKRAEEKREKERAALMPKRRMPMRPVNKSTRQAIGSPNAESECRGSSPQASCVQKQPPCSRSLVSPRPSGFQRRHEHPGPCPS
ncbi:DEHA2G25102p [Debaryomyces hansenii CBS767]|uniref:DEHA2G25102p n=1 Tax=Debaryomyces hansenii (strain ATCC 36239 / CBS 767 / BCRC 21394 / JCM 1990 / NBRC 0083 / IGC 2968) TaxID=284592 RepID=Q6BGN1_DEBHA|nr:DEHA2G25102p [Debaryomyces hansenii CBS767]CAG91159.2 DEHA2G25102p [Debaryomyces hansenii CBS767]|eukprot:XP_462640.2 DEHA2G25102p [Debaryomyces hansenii CBS767]